MRPSGKLGNNNEVQSGAGYLLRPEDTGLRVAGAGLGGIIDWNAQLPALVDITDGRVKANPDNAACGAAANASIPAEVYFFRSVSHVGLPSAEYHATTKPPPPEDPTVHSFAISLPAGNYDVYVKPELPPECATSLPPECCLPPYLVRQLPIEAGNAYLNIPLPKPIKLTGQVSTALDISDWTIALVDRVGGQLISTEPTLVHDALLKIAQYELYYHPTASPESYLPPWVRVRAPAPDYSPVVAWELENVDLDGNSEVDLSIADSLTKPVPVQATVLSSDERTPVESSVTLVGSFPKAPVTYRKTLQTDSYGSFATELFPASQEEPAHYQAFARPVDDNSLEAIGMAADWEIRADEDCFCGHTVVLPQRSVVSAQVFTRAGEPLDAPVSAVQSAETSDPVAPRQVDSDIVSGSLSLRLDPGTFDLAIMPAPESGFPWLVTSQLKVPTDQTATQLGTLEVPFPVVLHGRVLDAMGQSVPHAALTAWLPVIDPADESSSVVQIAEAVSDAEGFFTLLLPPTLTH